MFNLIILASMFILSSTFAQERLRVAVVDTGLDLGDKRFKDVLCASGHKDYTNTGMRDNNGHGTHIAGLIKKYAKDSNYCLVIIKVYDSEASSNTDGSNMGLALMKMTITRPNYVNISMGGSERNSPEYSAIRFLKSTKFFVSAGNNGNNVDEIPFYPASYRLKNETIVGNLGKNGIKHPSSNYGKGLAWEVGEDVKSTLPEGKEGYMTGSSMSTAIRTGKVIYNAQHPKSYQYSLD